MMKCEVFEFICMGSHIVFFVLHYVINTEVFCFYISFQINFVYL